MEPSSSSSDEYQSFLQELIPPECSCSYCFLKLFLRHCHPNRRTLVQLKCIEKFKWLRSEQKGHNCGWEPAIMEWVEDGYAEAFAESYMPNSRVDDIFDHCCSIVRDRNSSGEKPEA